MQCAFCAFLSFRKPVKLHILGLWNAEQNEACQIGGCICHPERSEGSPIAQNKNIRNEILRLTAQNDNQAGEHSSPLRVGNNLCVVPQNYIKIYGRAWKPAPTVG